MRVDDFDFELPPRCIANRPASPRDSARLLRVTGAGLTDRSVRDLPSILLPEDVLVFNDTRVIPARLGGTRGAVDVEILLHHQEQPGQWLALARPAKRLKEGDTLRFADDFAATVLGRTNDGSVRLRFDQTDETFFSALSRYGHIPLPPYIDRPDDDADQTDYQTVYADKDGAIAAPTAGLHFTPRLFDALADAGIETEYVTLHVGLGTFQPIKVDDTDDHAMHSEWGEISSATASRLTKAKGEGRRLVSVGTTSLRLLESACTEDGVIKPYAGSTDLFIVPGYTFKAVDLLMTNFHLPRSTLFMLVSAFSGRDRMQSAYAYAIDNGYRFYSYGDACLLERAQNP